MHTQSATGEHACISDFRAVLKQLLQIENKK